MGWFKRGMLQDSSTGYCPGCCVSWEEKGPWNLPQQVSRNAITNSMRARRARSWIGIVQERRVSVTLPACPIPGSLLSCLSCRYIVSGEPTNKPLICSSYAGSVSLEKARRQSMCTAYIDSGSFLSIYRKLINFGCEFSVFLWQNAYLPVSHLLVSLVQSQFNFWPYGPSLNW